VGGLRVDDADVYQTLCVVKGAKLLLNLLMSERDGGRFFTFIAPREDRVLLVEQMKVVRFSSELFVIGVGEMVAYLDVLALSLHSV